MDKLIIKPETVPQKVETQLYSDVCSLIENTRGRVATTVNAEIIMLNWQIGVRIKDDVLLNQRAEYGKQVVKNLAVKLTERYGRGWSDRKLLHCIRAADTFSEEQRGCLKSQFKSQRIEYKKTFSDRDTNKKVYKNEYFDF